MIGRRDIFEQSMRQGHSAAWDQQWDQALAAYSAALQEVPDDAHALTSLGFVLLQTNRLPQALACYQRAARLNPGDPMAPEKCGEIFERLGRGNEAAQTYLAVAEVHLKRRDVQKAMDNWARVVRLAPDNLAAHSRLALASERLGLNHQAALEYIEVARLFQRARDNEKATAALGRAQQLDPNSPQVRDALDRLRRGVSIVLAERPKITTGPLRAGDNGPVLPPELVGAFDPAAANGAHAEAGSASPLAAAQSTALSMLADLLFQEDAELLKPAGGMGVLTRGSGKVRDSSRRAQAIKALGQAITNQSAGDTQAAIEQYEASLRAGLESPVVNFVLGALYLEQKRYDAAARWFQSAIQHEEVGLGALFGLGQAEHLAGRSRQALPHLLAALRRLDLGLVAPQHADGLEDAYESLAEQLQSASDSDVSSVAGAVLQFLSGDGWEERVRQARRQLDSTALDGQVAPLADLLALPGAGQVVDSLRRIEGYMARGLWATAMEEAYFALSFSPGHLPTHVRMAEILVAEGKVQAAIDKYTVVAETYRGRGELARAARITQQVLKLSPLDVSLRSWLIEILVEQNRIGEALQQFNDLAETYYQLADLDSARTAYADALLLAQQHGLAGEWAARLLHKMGDIDLQRLNWRDAQRVYEQIRDLAPDDHVARATLVDLLFRLGNNRQALAEVDAYLRQLLASGQTAVALSLLEEMLEAHPADQGLVLRLARLYADAGRRDEAITQYDHLGELQLQSGQTAQAAETIRAILALDPPNPGDYQQLLEELQS